MNATKLKRNMKVIKNGWVAWKSSFMNTWSWYLYKDYKEVFCFKPKSLTYTGIKPYLFNESYPDDFQDSQGNYYGEDI
jgi:hypothetical protein